MRRIFVIAWPVVIALGAGLMAANHFAHHTPGDGAIRLASLPADVFYLDASEIARRGPGGGEQGHLPSRRRKQEEAAKVATV